jgi:hypothetical protein
MPSALRQIAVCRRKLTLITFFLLLSAGAGLILLPHSPNGQGAEASTSSPRAGFVPAADGVEIEGQEALDERDLYWASRRGLQFGVPTQAYASAVAQMAAMQPQGAPAGIAPNLSWDFPGPLPMLGDLPNFGGIITGPPLSNATGRVSALAVDPATPGRLFVGTAGGGVWMTNDGGASFKPIFDAQPSLAIGAIAINPKTTPVTIFVATGEGNGSDSFYGQGIFKSADLGKTWIALSPGTFNRAAFTKLAIDSNNPPHLFAAVTGASSLGRADPIFRESNPANAGLWRSTDGGTSWSQYPAATFGCFISGNPCPAMDVVVDPSNPKKVYAAIEFDNVFISTDGGGTWTGASFPGIAAGLNQMGRQTLAIAPSAPSTVYAMLGAPGGAPNVGQYVGFFQSNDSGAHWIARTVPSMTFGAGANAVILDGTGTTAQTYSQSFYDQALIVKPDNASALFFGGIGAYVSANSGSSWGFIGGSVGGAAQTTHADQHAAVVDPFNTSTFYVGNDGGVYSYNAASKTWRALNFTISAGQIQAIGPHPSDNNKAVSGFQDNGTQLYGGSQGWQTVETGDGGFALFDLSDPAFVYHTFASSGNPPLPQLATSTDGGKTWDSGTPTTAIGALIGASGGGPANFYPPLAVDPWKPHRVMLGAHAVFVSTDGMFSWQLQTTQDLTGGCTTGACALQDLQIVPGDETKGWSLSIQARAAPSPGATPVAVPFKVFNTAQADLNGGAVWNDVTANLGFSASATQATGIATDFNNPNDAYLSVSGFTASTGVGHIFRTTDFGATWTRADGAGGAMALPDVPVLRVLIDRTDVTGNTIFAATDIGVFHSIDGGASWTALNLSIIPSVPVVDVEQNYNGVVFAGTHGRGAYRLSFKPEFAAGSFTTTGNMTTARFFHSVSALANGKALVAGGVIDNFHALSSAELYDPVTHSFSATGSLQVTTDDKTATRSLASAALLLDGRVLIAGGQDTNFNALQSAQLYQPSLGAFTITGSMTAARVDGTATRLCDGRVLIAGGSDKNGFITQTAELYDPVHGTFSATGNMNVTRDAQTATLLHDCRVLMAGGANGAVLDSAELYDPVKGTFTLAPHTMVSERVNHAASLLADGRVLITGGKDGTNKVLSSAELFNPLTGTFTATGDMAGPRLGHSSIALANGQVLIAAGSSDVFVSTKLASAELYNPATGKFSAGGTMNVGRAEQAAVKLLNEQVVFAGGINSAGFSSASGEVYQPAPPATPMVLPTPTPTLKPSATPTSKPTPTPTRSPTRTPTATATATGTPTPTPTHTPTPTASPSPTPAPGHPSISAIPGTIFVGGAFTITGTNFTAGSVVNFFVATAGGPVNHGPLTPAAHTPTTLTVNVPPAIPLGQGFVAVQVVNTDKGFAPSNLASALLLGSSAAGIPSLTGINGKGLAATSSDPRFATDNVETVVAQGVSVKLSGSGFDIANGVAVDLFCACTGGKVGPFFLNPGNPGLTATALTFVLPSSGANAPVTGPGSFVISNAGGAHGYLVKSNAVSVPIGQKVSVSSVTQAGAIITVNGTGFSPLTVINFFNTQAGGVVNLGGLKADGKPHIALTFINATRFTFAKPVGAAAGPSYVQVFNPPFVPFTSSDNQPGGAFALK